MLRSPLSPRLWWPAWAIACFIMPRSASGTEPSTETTSSPEDTPGIVGGTAVAVCDWPTTVFLGNCTATLIHPRVITTAAHCTPRAGTKVNFGEHTPWAFTVTTTSCKTSGMPGGPKDWAYCILPDDDRLK